MKKFLAAGLLSVAVAQAGVFVGVQGGYDIGAGRTGSGKFDLPIYNGITQGGWSVGANAGYELNFGLIGLRGYLQLDYSKFLEGAGADKFHNIDIDLNVDALVNFINGGAFGMGVFVGVGAGYQYTILDTESVGAIPLFARAGLTFNILEHNRVDLGIKLPITGWNINGPLDVGFYSPLKIQASYKFIF
ncbi:outer membrane beta-barrel protein [Helicobacter saguini]|uniref:Outer membrane beta-barrel protein n=1 Tax=Helicobacter saguini TaxID=1548018 RepID=A0A347VP64_9HELI|nr:outer membrane beta-barrel protein [Helicobacter saguini]MWV61496.1 outer membrane beta-barrel protein [Helicobacter saguini]MWV67833.1 outer membrane beta-barrel protein [Helicobacter saguini]MWV70699.1 outer membrane beta-barrel protein [Helicobacter saguini]MWV72603.1 outer membrane beta-barrel protein [Helicobacter saguini]TLD94588.1 outer membrane beta-barrel protein [Helicobacter saguini]